MKRMCLVLITFISLPCLIHPHSQMIYTPALNIAKEQNQVSFLLTFTHPFDSGLTMDIGKNEAGEILGFKEVFLVHKGRRQDLTADLQPVTFTSSENSASAFTLRLDKKNGFRGGGDWAIVAVPHPYFEPSSGEYIQQVSKTIINKYGLATDWDKRLAEGYGEIIPLVKPYEVFTHMLFRAVIVDAQGKPVPYADIEFVYINYDVDTKAHAFTGSKRMEVAGTGVIKADASGSFAFVPARSGMWGFTAFIDSDQIYNGKKLSHEAVIWIDVQDIPQDDVPVVEKAGASSVQTQQNDTAADISAKAPSESPKRYSPMALIVVILLFLVLFAWPPLFKKYSDRYALRGTSVKT